MEKEGKDDEYKETAGTWQRYLTGRAKPFRTWKPYPRAIWVDECEEVFPGTAAWFYSPIWYLLEDIEFLPRQILECVRLLPEHLRDDLLTQGVESTRSAFLLADLEMNAPPQIATEVSVWSLGAMACVMRRAELSGKSALFRWAGIGIIWILDQIDSEVPIMLKPLLHDLRGVVVGMLEKFVYPLSAPMTFPLTAKEFERFSCQVQRVHAISQAAMDDDYGRVDQLMSLKWFETTAWPIA